MHAGMTMEKLNYLSTDQEHFLQHNNNSGDKLLENGYQTSSELSSSKRKGIFAQSLITSVVMLSAAACGMPIGYSAILLPQLKKQNTTLYADDDVGSWIASIHSAATPLGSVLSGMLMEKIGRKTSIQIASVPLIVGWMFIALANNHVILLLGRFIAGLAVGLTAAAGQVLIGEISEPQVRGILTSVPFASYSFGILLVYALGAFLDWRIVAGLSTLLPTVAIIIFFFLPESPVWLVKQNQVQLSLKILTWLRGGNFVKAKQETQIIVDRISSEREKDQSSRVSLATFLEPQVLKPFLIVNIFNLLQTLSGTYLIVFYAVEIINHMSGQNVDSLIVAVLSASVRLLFSIVASILLGLIGRRTLAISSGIGSAISALCLGTYLYYYSTSPDGYFAALCVLFYIATNTVGFMILPGVIISELYPTRIRGTAGGLSFMIFNFILFGAAKIFPFIKSWVAIYGIFWIFGLSSLFASLFVYVMLPETKGVSLNDIEDYFLENNTTWINRKEKRQKTDKISYS